MTPTSSTPRPNRLPPPTYTPAIVGAGIVLVAWGAVTILAIVALGVLLLGVGLAGWIAALRRND